jgi:hypothetical protein
MLKRYFGPQIHHRVHFFVLSLFIIGVVCSKFLMSMGLLLGVLNLLLEGNFNSYYQRLRENPLVLFILAFYSLHLFGLLWTTNLDYGMDDIRKKTSLLLIPIIVGAHSIPSPKRWTKLIHFFILTLVITASINLIAYHFFAEKLNLIDIRDMSLFGSHIRYGILMGIGLAFCLERLYQGAKYRNGFIASALFFLLYTFYSQVLSGIIAVAIVLGGLLFFVLWQRRQFIFLISSVLVLILGSTAIIYYLSQPVNYPISCVEQYDEMESAWNLRSTLNYDSLDKRKQPVASTLERYLSSKGLCANTKGVQTLTKEDIQFIETGFADVHETYGGIQARLLDIRYQLHHASNPSGHSILERIEYWKNAWAIIENNWILGVGTGDVDDAMQEMYNKRQSPLTPERRLRAHNSYLTYYLTFGIFGFLFFLYFQLKFIIQQWKWQQRVGFLFGLIALVTFLFEDTLESQMGITMFAFFYAVFSRKITSK